MLCDTADDGRISAQPRRLRVRFKLLVLAGLGCSVAGAALAATAAETIATRQQNYKQIGRAFKAIGDELKKDSPSLALVGSNAGTIGDLGRRIPNWFPKGTGPEAGVKTGALPVIWEKPADFRHAAANLVRAAREAQAAAASGDVARTKAAAGAIGQACKGCHDTFRARNS
jgi:cytochrome c556